MNDAGRRWPVGVTVLTVLGVFYTLYFARAFLIPITFAVLLDFLLSPAVRALVRWHLPLPLAAGDLFLQKLIKVLPNVHDRHKAIEIARATEA
jgi:predicted PurR-regulated permease PerM